MPARTKPRLPRRRADRGDCLHPPFRLKPERALALHSLRSHFHCCVIDGVFEPAVAPDDAPSVSFHAALAHTLDAAAFAGVQTRVRTRVLPTFVKRGLIDQDDATEMRAWAHDGGFSVDGSVRIEGVDRTGLERLLRYDQRKSPCGTAHAHLSHSNICSNATPSIWSITAPRRAPTRPAIWC